MRPLREHLTYANTMATVAFLLATSGTAYAAVSIGSKDIVDDSVKSVDLKDGKAVKGADVVDGSLTGADIDESSLTLGVQGYQRVYGGDHAIAAGAVETYAADCPVGKVAISGGFWTDTAEVRTFWGYATDDDTYTVAFWNSGATAHNVGVHVVCVDS